MGEQKEMKVISDRVYTALDYLKDGDMVLLEATVDEAMEPFFFIKDSVSTLVGKMGNSPLLQTKAMIFERDGALGLLVMFRMNKDDNMIYCKWFNYYDMADRKKLDMLLFRDKISFCTISTNNAKFATFESENKISFIIRSYCKEAKAKGKWSDKDFTKLSEKITLEFNNRIVLFNESKYYSM